MKSATTFLFPIAIGLVASSYAAPNTRVYLHPSPLRTASYDLTATPKDASRAVATFFGLDLFEPVGMENESEMEMYSNYEGDEVRLGDVGRPAFELVDEEVGPFVGKGLGRSLVISVAGEDNLEGAFSYLHAAKHEWKLILYSTDILPPTLALAFSAEVSPSSFSRTSLSLPTLLERANELYDIVRSSPMLPQSSPEPKPNRALNIFDLPRSRASMSFLNDLGELVDFIEWADFAVTDKSAFGAVDLSSLKDLVSEYGRDSAQYRAAASAIRAAISSAMTNPDLRFVVIAAPVQSALNAYAKRQQPPSQSPLPVPSPPPQHPISAVSTCFTSLDACSNSTNSCSNHGQCVSASKAGKTCFVCSCTPSKSINGNGQTKTTLWAGEQCERVDVSQEFVLLVGTTIGIIVLVFGSISLLYGVGGEKLPQVLAEGNVPMKRD